jgi:hypothetical protein
MNDKIDDKKAKKPGGPDSPDGPGGVQHDARGNAVWRWAVASGRHALDSTSLLLRRLEVPGLKLEDDPEVLKEKAEAQQPGDPAGPPRTVGYDPYGGASTDAERSAGKAPNASAQPSRPVTPSPVTPPPGTKPPQAMKPPGATKPATAPKPAPSLLRRLFRRD